MPHLPQGLLLDWTSSTPVPEPKVNLRADVVVTGAAIDRAALRFAQLVKAEIHALQAAGHVVLQICAVV